MYDIGTNDKWSGSSQQFGVLQLIDSLIKPSRGSVIFKPVKTQRQKLWVSPQEGQRPYHQKDNKGKDKLLKLWNYYFSIMTIECLPGMWCWWVEYWTLWTLLLAHFAFWRKVHLILIWMLQTANSNISHSALAALLTGDEQIADVWFNYEYWQ